MDTSEGTEGIPSWYHQYLLAANLKQLEEDRRQRNALVEWIAAIDTRHKQLNDENEAHLTAIQDLMFKDDQ